MKATHDRFYRIIYRIEDMVGLYSLETREWLISRIINIASHTVYTAEEIARQIEEMLLKGYSLNEAFKKLEDKYI